MRLLAVGQRRKWDVLGGAAVMVSAGAWSTLLLRLLFELAPLWFPGTLIVWLSFGLVGAGTVLLLLYRLGYRSGTDMILHVWPLAVALGYLVQAAVAPLWGIAALLAGAGGTLWLMGDRVSAPSVPAWVWDVLVAVGTLALYVATLAPSVLPGDSGEFQFVPWVLGIPHPTGYPLYLLLGRAFTRLPVGSVAYRLSLLSAVAGAGTVWAVYRAALALRLGRVAALVGAGLLMVSDTLWSQATIAEKYALNAFFVALTLWLALAWRARVARGERAAGWLVAWALSYGLSLTHHRTMILFAPVYGVWVWSTDASALAPRRAWRPLLLVLAPLTLYLILPLFNALNPPYAYLRLDSPRAFFDLVLARTYQSGLFRGGWEALPDRALRFAGLLGRQFGLVGLALAAVGGGGLAWRDKKVLLFLLAGMGVQILFALNYYVPNTPVYYLPAYVWLSVFVSVAIDVFLSFLRGARSLHAVRPHLSVLYSLMACALPVALCAARWQGMDRVRGYENLAFDYTYGQVALDAVQEGALIVSDWQPATVLWYLEFVQGVGAEAQIVSVDSLEWQWRSEVEKALADGRPAYLSRPVVDAAETHALSAAGPLVQVLAAPRRTAPRPEVPLEVDLGKEIRLQGIEWQVILPGPEGELVPDPQGAVPSGSTLYVTLRWQAIVPPSGDYAVTVYLEDAAGHTWIEKQNRHPVYATYPTSRWHMGEIVEDTYELTLPPDLPSGSFTLYAKVGLSFSEAGLPDDGGRDRVALETIEIEKTPRWPRPSPSIPLRVRCRSDLVLMGYDGPGQVTAGELTALSLLWLVRRDDLQDDLPRLVVIGTSGTEEIVSPWKETRSDWRRGALVSQQYVIPIAEHFKGMAVQRGEWRYRLPVRMEQAPAPVANFGNQILLRDYAYGAPSVEPGGMVRLSLQWEARTTIAERYKVFVHVLGQNGLPVAQQDNEPVNGTYPTTRWQRGEQIVDPYAFSLPADLAPGEYRVEVGLYRVADLTRLPVLDQEQRSIDDKVFLAPLVVE